MSSRTASRVLMSILFLALIVVGANVTAQNTPQAPKSGQNHHAGVESNPACQRIVNECKKLGFIQGEWKQDNGLWKDCFDPVVKGGTTPTRDGKPINVPVSQSDVQACRTAVENHQKQAPHAATK